MDKDTTLICTIGDTVKILHSTEQARDNYENKITGHEVITMDFTDADFERLTSKLKMV